MDAGDRYLEHTACPLCGADGSAIRPLPARGTHFGPERANCCTDCSLVFLSPRLSPAGLREYYRSDAFSKDFRGAATPSEEDNRYRDQRAQRRWARVRDYVPAGGSVLEVGCGNGSFLRRAADDGRTVMGIDPSDGYARGAMRRGGRVVSGEFPGDLPPDWTGFDAVAIFHVIEHVHDPLWVLGEIRSRLKPGGKLLLEYPDVERAARRERFGPEYFQKSHLHDFCGHTMTVLMRKSGFAAEQWFFDDEPPLDKNVLVVAAVAEPQAVDCRRPGRGGLSLYRHLTKKVQDEQRRRSWRTARRHPVAALRNWWRAA